MTNSSDQLKQALSDIICASIKRDRPDAAEKVLAAMERRMQEIAELVVAEEQLLGELIDNMNMLNNQPRFVPLRINVPDEDLEKLYKPNGNVYAGEKMPAPKPFGDGPTAQDVVNAYKTGVDVGREIKGPDPDVRELLDALTDGLPWITAGCPAAAPPDAKLFRIYSAHQKLKAKYE